MPDNSEKNGNGKKLPDELLRTLGVAESIEYKVKDSDHVRREKVRQRELQVITLRKAGASFQQIAKSLNISATLANTIASRALARVVDSYKSNANEVRALELERLDVMFLKLWPIMSQTTDPKLLMDSIKSLLQLQERRAKYLGLDTLPPLIQINNMIGGTTVNESTVNNTLNMNQPSADILKNATTEELIKMRDLLTGIQSRSKQIAVIPAEDCGTGTLDVPFSVPDEKVDE